MRVLIISACFAVAAAAPSGLFAPVITPIIVPAVKAVAVPAAVPTISPGDIQAAAIDLQVQARDFAQAQIDKAREQAELATENVQEKVITDATVVNEKNLEAFWSAEDQKWQAVDALKTAEAQIDGHLAKNADIIAKSAVTGLTPYITAVGLQTPIVQPIPPAVYTPYLGAQSYSSQTLATGQVIKTEIKEENKDATIVEAAVKSAESAKQAEQSAAEKAEKAEGISTQSPAVKAAENLNEKPALIGQPLLSSPLGLANIYRYDVAVPAGHVIAQPIVKYGPAVPSVHGVLTPTFVKTVW